jgi:acyl carrier protein
MELEAVELIMAVEEEFMIEIPDTVAESIISIGQLSSVVQSAISRAHRELEQEIVFERIADIAAHFGGEDRGIVGPETRLIEDLGLR